MPKRDKTDAQPEQQTTEPSLAHEPEPVDQFEEDIEFLKEADTMDAFVSMVVSLD